MSARRFLRGLNADGFTPASLDSSVHSYFGLRAEARRRSVAAVGRLLAHAASLCVLYESARYERADSIELMSLFAQHCTEQSVLVASLVERTRTLGMGMGMPQGLAATAAIQIGWRGGGNGVAWLRRILEAHELGLSELETMWRQANLDGDRATYDLIVDEVVRINERQSWLVAEQLVRHDSACALRRQGVTACPVPSLHLSASLFHSTQEAS